MAALLKDVYDQAYIADLTKSVHALYPDFNSLAFNEAIFDSQWQAKELKARTLHLANQLHAFIDLDYAHSLNIIQKIASHFTGYQGMFIPAFVELYGLSEFKLSTDSLAYITQYASAEFAVRPFIQHYPQKMHRLLLDWAKSDNEHLRRLASEGCRPRLPWAMGLPEFKKNPAFILPILDALRDDSSEYVRRSVANNLNDIAKDHPQIVITIATNWLAESHSKARQRLVKHACRSLLKQAHPQALALFGFLPPKHIKVENLIADKTVKLGGTLHFSCVLKQQQGKCLNKVRIEFAIDFMKKNGKQARKIFQLSESVIEQDTKIINKAFSFKKISTRAYYCGQHSLAILVNGVQLHEEKFVLIE